MENKPKLPKSVESIEKARLDEKYAETVQIFEEFHKIACLGDLTSIYRSRACFAAEKRKSALVKPAIDVFRAFPASRPTVFHYTGLLIHESAHHWFNAQENVQQVSNITIVNEATCELLDFYMKFFAETDGNSGLEECLQWLCEICSELSSKNAGRPAMLPAQQNAEILQIWKSNDVIDKLLSLLSICVTSSLAQNSVGCMRALFEASRHGQHFSWIWLHIATLLQGSIITHLLESGAEQFRTYVIEISSRKTVQTGGPAVLNIIQTEYEHKFRAISDVFNFLMQKRNPELQEAVSQLIVDSLDFKPAAGRGGGSVNRLGFAFFFKLVTCSLKTLQILVNTNCHLITPFNVIRAIRQVQTVEKSLILPAITFSDFIKQIVEDVDPITHGIIFELLVELVYNPAVFEGENLPEFRESNEKIRADCFPVLDVMISRIIRIAHSAGGYKCSSLHPAIQLYSSGEKLQFIIDSAKNCTDNLQMTSSIIRHLHAISIAFDESKAAEIALRFLMTTDFGDSKKLEILMAYLSATVPFYPQMLAKMWAEFGGLRELIAFSFDPESPLKRDSIHVHMNLLHNFRTIFDWELHTAPAAPKNSYGFWKLYPGQHIGSVLNTILTNTVKICWELQEANKLSEVITIYRLVTKLIEGVCQSNSTGRTAADQNVKNSRKMVITLSQMYKLMAQFAILLKNALLLVGRDLPDGIVIFEELRAQCLYFLFGNHLDPQLSRFSPVFVQIFVQSCYADAKKLFHEPIIDHGLEQLLDETQGLGRILDMQELVDGPSVIGQLKSLKMRDSALAMLHTGQLKRRRLLEDPVTVENENATQRVYVVLDAIRLMCTSGKLEIRIGCSKHLAQALLQTICKDSLMSDMRFDEWDSEAEFIHRHVEIAQRIARSPFSDGILRILAETRSFAYCLPIMKSKLAVLLNDTEKFPEHVAISEPTRQKLQNWVFLAQKGGILPGRLAPICDLEQFSTCHETHLMLVEIWRFFVVRQLNTATIDTYHMEILRGDVDEGLPAEKESIDKINTSVFRIIIQNHLPDSAHLFPKIFPLEFEFLKLCKVE